jgi:hypothetical protein
MKDGPADDGGTSGKAVLAAPARRAVDGPALKLTAALLVAGVVVSLLAGLFHPDAAPANDHAAAFAGYARSDIWTGVHLAQFVGMALLIAGCWPCGLRSTCGRAPWPGQPALAR